ncbi:MAG: hypothetical protein R3345_00770 [Fulvivirga sp.]|nr:hypothetical protein [Fulvivirga sp.]
MRKFRIGQYCISILILFVIGNSITLDYLLKERHLACDQKDISFISLLNRDGLNTQELNEVISRLNIAKPEAIICLDCESEIQKTKNLIVYNSDSLSYFYEKNYTSFEKKGMNELLKLVSYDNTKYKLENETRINLCNEIDDIYKIDLNDYLSDYLYKISKGIIIIYSENNLEDFKLTSIINTVYTLLFDNYYDLSNFIPLFIFFTILVALRYYLFYELSKIKYTLLKEIIYILIALSLSFFLFKANILLDYLLVLILLFLIIISENLLKKKTLTKMTQ